VQQLSGSAVAIGMLGLLEAIAMAKSIAARTKQKLDINQQCLSEGLANLTGSFFQCFPGSGSLTRSYINHQAGAATQWSGVICAAAVALTMLALAPLAQYIPRAALAGVLLLAATRMIDVAGIRYHFRATKFDAVIVTATALSAVFVSIEFCILVGTLLSFLIYVPKAAKVTMEELVIDPNGMIRERYPNDVPCDRIKMVSFEGELFFGSAPDFESHLEQIEIDLPATTKVILIRVKHLRNPDAVCMHLLAEFIDRIDERGIAICLAGVRDDFFKILDQVGIVARLGSDRVFRETAQVWSSTTTAMNWAHDQLGDDLCATCPRRNTAAGQESVWNFAI
jgi:SulP family sulfate permease